MITSITDEGNNNNNENENSTLKKRIKTNIEITPLGYMESKRKKDGITYFGYEKEKNDIDIFLNPLDGEINDDKFYGKHFRIKFNPDDLNYYLKDLGQGFGTFIRINSNVEIKNNFLLNIGENYLIFSLLKETGDSVDSNINSLNIKLFSVSCGQKSFDFKKEDSPITIGRKQENNIFIEDNMLSRIHCTLYYKENKWFLIDGSFNNEDENDIKKSTNGTWIYAFDDTLIYDKMCFKSSNYLFECYLVDVTNNKNNNSFSIQNNDLNIV